jgi:hypothetical protein
MGKWNDDGCAEDRERGAKQQGDLEVIQFQVSLHRRNQQTEAMHQVFPGEHRTASPLTSFRVLELARAAAHVARCAGTK